jgi:hypothetical protein
MNLIIIVIGALVVTCLTAMLAIDTLEEHDEQRRAVTKEIELQQLQSSFETKEKKNVIFLDLGGKT